jgi:hypothetical protein
MISRAVAILSVVSALACSKATTGPSPQTYTPGVSYFGQNNYIEYIAGNAPILFSASHGGELNPSTIPDRTDAHCGGSATTVTDLNTIELVRAMQRRYFARFGKYPHVVINHLARKKLDTNRTATEAACGNAEALTALNEWHDFINIAKTAVLSSSGKGWYMDMHGHGHTIQRLELGYLLSSNQLDLSDASLDAIRAYQDTASMRTISEGDPISFSALLRGPASLGTLYEANGFRSMPSSTDPGPHGDPYLSGGDNTRRHACGAEATPFGGITDGNICGVQIESNFSGVRDNAANMDKFGDATAIVLEQYLFVHWALKL